MVKKLIGTYLINLLSLVLASQIVSSFFPGTDLASLLIITLGFTFVHFLIKPIINLVLKPLNLVTLGLISFIVDVAILYALVLYLPQVAIDPWSFPGLDIIDITIAPRTLGKIETTVVVSAVINFIRGFLTALFY